MTSGAEFNFQSFLLHLLFRFPRHSLQRPTPAKPQTIQSIDGKSAIFQAGYLFGFFAGAQLLCPERTSAEQLPTLKAGVAAIKKLHALNWRRKEFSAAHSGGQTDATRYISEHGGSTDEGFGKYCAEFLMVTRYRQQGASSR